MLKTTLMAALFLVGGLANAGGGMGGIVFDPTNFAKNAITAAESVRAVQTAIRQLETQIEQYRTMGLQLKGMAEGNFAPLLTASREDILAIANAQRAYSHLGRSIDEAKNIYARRMDEAKLMGVNWDKYLQFEQERIAVNRDGAAARVEAEARALQRIESDYAFAREMSGKIPMTEGTHSAIQQSNAILNRLVTQNAEILRALAQANGQQKADEIVAAQQRAAAEAETRRRLMEAQKKVTLEPSDAVAPLMRGR